MALHGWLNTYPARLNHACYVLLCPGNTASVNTVEIPASHGHIVRIKRSLAWLIQQLTA